jgi:hypothetical protein
MDETLFYLCVAIAACVFGLVMSICAARWPDALAKVADRVFRL